MERLTDLNMLLNPVLGAAALADGNPGALNVLLQLAETATTTDPDNAFGAAGPMQMLDSLGIYGSSIWVLFKDVCGSDLTRTHAVLRAAQLGLLRHADIQEGVTRDTPTKLSDLREKVENIVATVQETLPNFAADSDGN